MTSFSWVLFVLVPFGFVWVLCVFGYAYIKRMRDHPFPDRKTVEFVFIERRASGNSDTDFKSRYGGATNCLTVGVSADDLLVWGPDVFAAISARIDLECRVALGDVVDVRRAKKRVVEVRHRCGDGRVRTLRLWLKDVGGFVAAVEAGRLDCS